MDPEPPRLIHYHLNTSSISSVLRTPLFKHFLRLKVKKKHMYALLYLNAVSCSWLEACLSCVAISFASSDNPSKTSYYQPHLKPSEVSQLSRQETEFLESLIFDVQIRDAYCTLLLLLYIYRIDFILEIRWE